METRWNFSIRHVVAREGTRRRARWACQEWGCLSESSFPRCAAKTFTFSNSVGYFSPSKRVSQWYSPTRNCKLGTLGSIRIRVNFPLICHEIKHGCIVDPLCRRNACWVKVTMNYGTGENTSVLHRVITVLYV